MDSFFAKLYLDLQARLKAEVPEIVFVEQNFGQWINDGFRAEVQFPALLIDFPSTTYSAMSEDIQLGVSTISLTLMFEAFSQSYSIAPTKVKEQAVNYFEIEHKIYKALQGWNRDYFTPMVRTDARSENKNGIGLRIRELNFTTEFEDWSLDNETETPFTFSFSGTVGT